MKKTKRKLLAVLLAFTMLFGSSMTVFAQDYVWHDLIEGQTLTDQDAIKWTGWGDAKLEVYENSSGTLKVLFRTLNDASFFTLNCAVSV